MRITATRILFIAAIIFGIFVSDSFSQSGGIRDIHWELVSAYGETPPRSTAFIEIRANRVTGNTGCNNMFGNVTSNGSRIVFGDIGSTKRMCKMEPGSIPEHTFVRGLNDAFRFRRSGDQLTLIDRHGRPTLKFRAATTPEPGPGNALIKLEDRKWVLESIKGRQTFVALPYAFLNFDARKGSAGGDTSCNTFGGSYSVSRSTVKFSNTISTMRACIEDSKMSVERDMLDGLKRANRFELRDGRCFFTDLTNFC